MMPEQKSIKRRSKKPPEQRFWAKVDKNGPLPAHCPELGNCWVWIGHVAKTTGYGQFWDGEKLIQAHHFLTGIPVPAGMYGCHKCDNRKCVRGDHIFVGTPQANTDDAAKKGRLNYLPGLSCILGSAAFRGRGEAHPRAKLTWEAVAFIRQNHIPQTSNAWLAERFGVPRRTISYVTQGKSWKEEHRPISVLT